MKPGVARPFCLDVGVGLLVLGFTGIPLFAQAPIGSVALADVTVTGSSGTENDRAMLVGNASVTAKDRVAYVELFRGGSVRVCATSGLHLTAGAAISPAAAPAGVAANPAATGTSPSVDVAPSAAAATAPVFPLMLALDRGAVELHMNATASDVLMTPDLHIGFSEDGLLDLRIRVTRNGDTCVENRVAGLSHHPTLHIGSMFGSDNYNVLPGQHVLFEGGNLREVVDNESSPCGCPEESPKTVAPAGDISLLGGSKVPEKQTAAARYPFPAAVSQGLAPPPPVPQAPPGVTHNEVATSLVYSGGTADDAAKPDPAKTAPASAPQAVPKRGFFGSIGHFFKRAFGGQ